MARGFSHSGRGGGSFSGGSFRGGGGGGRSYSSSSSGSSYRSRPRTPWRIPMFGRTVVISTGARSVFSIFIGLLIFMIVGMVGIIGIRNDQKEEIAERTALIQRYEEYDEIYSNIITKARENYDGYYTVEIDVSRFSTYSYYDDDPVAEGFYQTDIYMDGQYYYFVVYNFDRIDDVARGENWNDSTFTQYTSYGLRDIKNNKLKIAYTVIDGEVWAINTDYTLEKNKDYAFDKKGLAGVEKDYKSQGKIVIGLGVASGLIVVGIVIYLVIKFKQAKKNQAVQDAKDQAAIDEARAKADLAEAQAAQVNRTCDYCGSKVPDGATECPSCGSRYFKD